MNNFSKFLVAGSILLSPMANAGLLGDSVDTSATSSLGNTVSVLDTIVGAGEEGNFFGNQFFDYGDMSFDLRSNSDFQGYWTTNPEETVTILLSDLNFGAMALTGVDVVTTFSSVTTNFGMDWVSFTWNEQAFKAGDYLNATFSSSSVPEPSIAILMASGLIVFGVARRQRRL